MTLSRAYAYIIIACLLWIAVMAYLTVAIVQAAQPVAPEVVVIEQAREKPEAVEAKVLTLPLDEAEVFEATAYTAGPESTGKRPGDAGYGVTFSGLRVKPGMVAVDPDVIPLGSIVWVEGYGLAVAADVGSAIQGRRVDVFYQDVNRALEWGRKNVKVAVLR